MASNGGNIREYEGIDKSSKPMCPMIAINITAGTASEITRFCIITDTNPLTNATAMMAITMITQYLPKAAANGVYIKARDKMAYGQYLAGIAFNNASLGYVHAMAHQLGGFYNLPHGVCNAILLPHVEEFNLLGNANRFRDIARAMGENIDSLSTMEAARKAIAAICTPHFAGAPETCPLFSSFRGLPRRSCRPAAYAFSVGWAASGSAALASAGCALPPAGPAA